MLVLLRISTCLGPQAKLVLGMAPNISSLWPIFCCLKLKSVWQLNTAVMCRVKLRLLRFLVIKFNQRPPTNGPSRTFSLRSLAHPRATALISFFCGHYFGWYSSEITSEVRLSAIVTCPSIHRQLTNLVKFLKLDDVHLFLAVISSADGKCVEHSPIC